MKSTVKVIKNIAKMLLRRSVIVDIVPPIEFVGWRMATGTRVPWMGGGGNKLAQEFTKCDQELMSFLVSKKLILSQFQAKSVLEEVAQLRWRHYVVYWSATVASQIEGGVKRNFEEMGVCDGLTAWFASHARQKSKCQGEFFLYDAWEEMRSDLLTSRERLSAGSYAYLNIDNTRQNLYLCGKDDFIFNKGYVPQSFSHSRNPENIAWMHIDLNSSIPTIASLEYFWDKLLPGGIVLLDDFAWPGYEETQIEVEKWCDKRGVNILHFPTGQAIITKIK